MEQSHTLDKLWEAHKADSSLKIWSVEHQSQIKSAQHETLLQARITELEWFLGTVLFGEGSSGKSLTWKDDKCQKYIKAFNEDPLNDQQNKPDWKKLIFHKLKSEVDKVGSQQKT